jgi:hypothetical protein
MEDKEIACAFVALDYDQLTYLLYLLEDRLRLMPHYHEETRRMICQMQIYLKLAINALTLPD